MAQTRKLISDRYRANRGNWSRLLKISCKSCGNFLFFYQKDGPGVLKRCYLDRIKDLSLKQESFYCPQCRVLLGLYEPYKKEGDRPAVRWLVDALKYNIIPYSLFEKSRSVDR